MAHQVPAAAEEGDEPVGEEVDKQLDGEEAGEEVVENRDEAVGRMVFRDLNVDDVGHEILRAAGWPGASLSSLPIHPHGGWCTHTLNCFIIIRK